MNYRKLFLMVFLASIGLWQTACLPINFAQSPKQPTNQASENKGQEISVSGKSPFGKKEADLPKEVKAEPTPKRKQREDNFVCPEPNLPCHHGQKQFDEWELSFRMPAKIAPNKVYKSSPFYAVILKKYDEGCDELDVNPTVEPERRRIQKLFPSRKVFAEYSCPNMSAVGYNFAGKMDEAEERVLYSDYIAVYAGAREAEGREIFELIREGYPQAELKKMTVAYSQIEQ